MKKLFIIANWKSNKTASEAKEWLQEFQISNVKSQISNKEIIICPPFTLLPILKSSIINLKSPVKLGAQDISPFDEGAYTGEVNGRQIKEFADYVIIGHSERRTHLKETDEILVRKVEMARKYSLTPIFCVQGESTSVPSGIEIVAYEPVFAIGSGNPDTPENANTVSDSIKQKTQVQYVLYGGSVTSQNVSQFSQQPHIDGVLVGGASLDADEFAKIIQNA